ncbi:MAG: Wadjet anti-phage system protein JetA family protein [Halothiobacillaceae bacterium]
MREDVPSLFDRLPEGLFGPLGSANRRRYWDILTVLYDDYFSETVVAPPEGYNRRDLVVPIERYLEDVTDWVAEDGDDFSTPINVRANQILSRLIDAGWLSETPVGLRRVVEIRPDVRQFLEMLFNFADQGPQFIGGQVQSIYNNLKAVSDNPSENAVAFHQAAEDTKGLVNSLSATGMQVRDLMQHLRRMESASDYIERFFTDYISAIYIADYRELHTSNHPLQRKNDVLEITQELRFDDAKRQALLQWYGKNRWGRLTAEQQMERDFQRFGVFERIEDHLDRLSQVVRKANQQAIAYIHYQLRTSSDLDQFIDRTLERLCALPEGTRLDTHFASGSAFAQARLAEPARKRPAPKRKALRRRELSPEQLALRHLLRAMQENRTVSPRLVARYLDAMLGDREEMASDEITVTSVRDLCVFLALARTGAAGRREVRNTGPLSGYELFVVEGERMENEYLEAPRIMIRRRGSSHAQG